MSYRISDSVTVAQLIDGFTSTENSYNCMFCDASFQKGRIYPLGDGLLDARLAAKQHISSEHGSVFHSLLALDKKGTGLTDIQRTLLRHFYEGMSDREIHHAAKGLRHLLVPELALAAEVEGKMIGATFCLLDYNPIIKAIDGRLFPFGFLRLILSKRKIKKLRLISANVVPEYQRMGMGLVLLGQLVPFCRKWGMQEVEFSWIAESNWISRGSLEKGGAKKAKTYRVYDLNLEQ